MQITVVLVHLGADFRVRYRLTPTSRAHLVLLIGYWHSEALPYLFKGLVLCLILLESSLCTDLNLFLIQDLVLELSKLTGVGT